MSYGPKPADKSAPTDSACLLEILRSPDPLQCNNGDFGPDGSLLYSIDGTTVKKNHIYRIHPIHESFSMPYNNKNKRILTLPTWRNFGINKEFTCKGFIRMDRHIQITNKRLTPKLRKSIWSLPVKVLFGWDRHIQSRIKGLRLNSGRAQGVYL